jgi:hypothetical protein
VPADVHDPPQVPQNFQQGAMLCHRASLTADEQLQPSLTRGRDPTRHRRLQDLYATLDRLLADGPGSGRGVAESCQSGRSGRQFFEGASLTGITASTSGTWQHGDPAHPLPRLPARACPPRGPARHGGFLRLARLSVAVT